MKKLSLIFAIILFAIINISCYAQSIDTSIANNNNIFAFKLYNELKAEKPDQNLFFSPFSISSALAMTYAGARGETEKQMSQAMNFSLEQNIFHNNLGALMDEIESDSSRNIQLSIANSLWAQKDYKFLDSYFNLVKANYRSELKNVDFIKETEKTRNEINNWVEQKTKNKIKELIKEKDIDSDTRLVLVNAIYFKDEWAKTFDSLATTIKSFYLNSTDTIHVYMMHKTENIKYYENSNTQVVEIPYKENKLSMIIFLPKEEDKFKITENSLNNGLYTQIIDSLKIANVDLSLPKFTATFDFKLNDALIKLGMPVAFGGGSDFSGMTGNKDLYISKVIHKSFINVTEAGTEAAAATAVIMRKISSLIKYFKIFNVDHPFIFLIKDNATGSILFLGKILNPKEQ
jgi:serpin B